MDLARVKYGSFAFSSCCAIALLILALGLPAGARADERNAQFQVPTFLPLTSKLASPQDILTLQPLFQRVLALDGIDDYASAPDSNDLDLGRGASPDFTIETFFYLTDPTPSGTKTLIEREQFSLELLLTSGTADSIQLHLHFETAEWSLFPVLSLEPGWHHLAVVYINEFSEGMDRASIYLDGTLQAFRTAADPGPLQNSAGPLYVGSPDMGPFGGFVEELRLSSTARYTGNSFEPLAVNFEPDEYTRALWHFDEYPGSTNFHDSSGGDHTLAGNRGAQTAETD